MTLRPSTQRLIKYFKAKKLSKQKLNPEGRRQVAAGLRRGRQRHGSKFQRDAFIGRKTYLK